ncbi:MAG: hypothetical protein AAFY15_11845, partial [Cyanobacteria bacterium J06648_11]
MPSANVPVNAFANQVFRSTVNLADGETGTLEVNVAADGAATGTLAIDDPDALVAAVSAIAIASPVVSGTVDLDTGAISLTGSYERDGQTIPISISGFLPGSTSGNSLSMVLGDETFGGSWSVASLPGQNPIPDPDPSGMPSPGPNPSGMPVPAPSTPPAGASSGTGELNFSSIAGANLDTAILNSSGFQTTAVRVADNGFETVTVSIAGLSTSNFAPRIGNVTIIAPNQVTPGTFAIAPPSNDFESTRSQIVFDEGTPPVAKRYTGQTGTVTVNSIDNDSVSITITDVAMQPDTT